jgi:hypothetical protein
MRWAVIGALLLSSTVAHAQDPAMESARTYFEGERRSGYLWGGFGLASLGPGIGFVASQNDLLIGMGIPMIVVGGIQTTIGILSLTRGPVRTRKLLDDSALNPTEVHARERERMQFIEKAFIGIGVVESLLLVSGAIVLGAGAASNNDGVRGAGIGIAFEMATMLFIDGLAHHRAEIYEKALAQ